MPSPTGDFVRWDTDKTKLFELYKKAQRIPDEYNSWDELVYMFSELTTNGATPKEALKGMGLDYRNVLGNTLIKINERSKMPEINRRAIREDINPQAELMIRERLGDKAFEAQRARYRKNWDYTQEDARILMQSKTGSQQHRGHGLAALEGGGVGERNLWPEEGMRNSLHSSKPRWSRKVMEQMGVDFNDVQEAYNDLLIKEGMGVGDYGFTGAPNYNLLQASDEYMVNPLRTHDTPYNIKGARGWIEGSNMNRYNQNPAALNPEGMANIQDKLNQLEAQGANKANLDKAVKNLSAKHSVGDATAQSGPVRVTKKAKPTVVKARKRRARKPKAGNRIVPLPKKAGVLKRAGRVLGPAAKLVAPAAIVAAAIEGGASNAAVTAAETLTPLGDMMAYNTADATLEGWKRSQAKIKAERDANLARKNRVTPQKKQQQLRRSQPANPVVQQAQKVYKRALDWLFPD